MAKKKVLIIDDEPMVTDFLAELVSGEGHHAEVCKTSHTAVNRVRQEDFHLVLLDINMPYIDGENLYHKLRKIKKDMDLPIVIISGSGLDPLLIQAVKKGVDTFILKPSPIGTIRERMDECLSRFEEGLEFKRILVIDDDSMVRDFLSEFLGEEGYKVVSTGDGSEALERIRTERFNLILLDKDMPRIGGTPLHSKIKNSMQKKPVPIMIMSGSGIEPSLLKIFEKGTDSYITKPLDVDIFRDKVKKCLAGGAK